MTSVIEEQVTHVDKIALPYEDDGVGNHLTHIIAPDMNEHLWIAGMTAKDIVAVARLAGREVVALCGHTWVPKRNPDKYPACQPCIQIASERIRLHEGGSGD